MEVPWVRTSLLEVTEASAPKGAMIEFAYPRGARAGERRTLEIMKWYESPSGVPMVTGKDLSVGGADRNYVVGLISDAVLLTVLKQWGAEHSGAASSSIDVPERGRLFVYRGAVRSAGPIEPGLLVRVQGLRDRAELNGFIGEVVKYEAERQRWEVQMIGGSGQSVGLRESHIAALSEDELRTLIKRGTTVARVQVPSRVPLRYAEMPLVQLKTGVNVGYSLCEVLGRAEQSIVGTAYCFDYPEGCKALAARQRSGVRVRVLSDHGQHLKPSCVNQHDRVAELLAWGVEFKTYRPPTGDKSCMHVKSWVCDGEVLIGGSANFTRNGIQNNVEHLIITRDDESITLYLEWFERLWLEGSSITDGRSFLG